MQKRWRRSVAEGAVIVSSILLAFGIEAAWSERQAGVEESDNLAALLTDLDEVIAEAELRVEQDESRVAEVGVLLDSLSEAAVPTDSALVALLYRLGNLRLIRARMDAYADLVSSGGITSIGDPNLRRLLARASYDLDLANRVSEDTVERNSAEFVDILGLAATDRSNLLPRVRLHGEASNRGRRFFIGRKLEALESARLAREAVLSAMESN